MQLFSNARTTKRFRTCLIFAAVILGIYLILHTQQPTTPYLPPLPGTYQYFRETDFHSTTRRFGAISHCDSRFAPNDPPAIDDVRHSLVGLLHSYATTMENLGVETWIAHGALLGWYWNLKFLPWDTDLDVQISADGIALLAKNYNMTEYSFALPGDTDIMRTYLLDINPHYSIASRRDVANKIDARWIDTTNGKFVDITAIHRDESATFEGDSSLLFCKDGHQYQEEDIYPLQVSSLEGIKVQVPKDSAKVLREEYGKKALKNARFHWHHFDHASKTWIPD